MVGYPRGEYLGMVLVSEALGVYDNGYFVVGRNSSLPGRQWFTKGFAVKLLLRLIFLFLFSDVSILV